MNVNKNSCGRRAFLGQMAAASVVAALPAWALPSFTPLAVKTTRTIMLDKVTLSDFSPHLNSSFILTGENGARIELRLIEAVGLGSAGSPRPAQLRLRPPFSLIFLAPPGVTLTQRTYAVSHQDLGEFEVFLVPVGLGRDGLKLEAIFN